MGQYFSGSKIANSLYDLLGEQTHISVIDPMCGTGDLLAPFLEKENKLYGIEIDDDAYRELNRNLNDEINAINANAFSKEALGTLLVDGYDIVVTNPPFIRREIYKQSITDIDGLPLEVIKDNLESFIKSTNTLNGNEKAELLKIIKTTSGLADISAYSIILCIALTKRTGDLALVLPVSWFSREYAKPLLSFIAKIFHIQYVILDANAKWFSGNAQVKTALLIAKRESIYLDKEIRVVNLFKSTISNTSITSFLEEGKSFKAFLDTDHSVPHKCEIRLIPQSNFVINPSLGVSDFGDIPGRTLGDMGVNCGQGFRSGANDFFILHSTEKGYESKLNVNLTDASKKFLTPIIQKQSDLQETYSVLSDDLPRLLFIQPVYMRKSEIESLNAKVRNSFKLVPTELERYIIQGESTRSANGTPLPEMSAVRTNVKRDNCNPRFWYHLPNLTPRHKGNVFIPRVNGNRVVARLNANDAILDANFISFWFDDSSFINKYILLALLNSSFFTYKCETTGTVMGGGALKLDAVQIKNLKFPVLSKKDYKDLDILGRKLSSATRRTSGPIITEIDSILHKADETIPSVMDLQREISKLISARAK